MFTDSKLELLPKMDQNRTSQHWQSGHGTEMDEMEKQFLADMEKAKALSMETAAFEGFRQKPPPSHATSMRGSVTLPKGATMGNRSHSSFTAPSTNCAAQPTAILSTNNPSSDQGNNCCKHETICVFVMAVKSNIIHIGRTHKIDLMKIKAMLIFELLRL